MLVGALSTLRGVSIVALTFGVLTCIAVALIS